MIALILASTLWLWDRPIAVGNNREIWQAFVCRAKVADGYRGCFAYGEGSTSIGVACPVGWWDKAAVDFPGEHYQCRTVDRADVDAPLGLKP